MGILPCAFAALMTQQLTSRENVLSPVIEDNSSLAKCNVTERTLI